MFFYPAHRGTPPNKAGACFAWDASGAWLGWLLPGASLFIVVGGYMKRVALLAAVTLITACLSFYIADYRLPSDNSIGYQEDLVENMASVSLLDETVSAETAVPADAQPQITTPSVLKTQAADISPTEPPAKESSSQDGWQLVWADEFDSPELSMEYWTETDRRDNYNEELQYYSPANSFVEDGRLILEARREDKDGKRYTSGMVETMNKLKVQFGRIEARMSLPVGKGFFPAFWMLTDDGNYEIDILEMIGSEPTLVYGCNHYLRGKTLAKNWEMTTVDDPTAFHVYAVEWDQASIRWYVDDKLYFNSEIGVPDEEMYMILTLAVGGVWPGEPNRATVFPGRMSVDYVRYYRAVGNGKGLAEE